MNIGQSTDRQSSPAARIDATLASRTDLPPRVRALLDNLLAEARRCFAQLLAEALEATETTLFKQAEQAGDNNEQQEHFAAMRELRRAKETVAPRFFAHIEDSLARVRGGPERAPSAPIEERKPLQLVNTEVLEEDLAVRDIAGRAEIRHSEPLYLLAHRIAVLGAMPVPAVEDLPLGPTQVTAAFRYGLDMLELATPARLLAFRQFERIVLSALGRCYEELNDYFRRERILPNLSFQAGYPRATPARPATAATPPEADDAARDDAAHAPEATAPVAAPAPPAAPGMPGPVPAYRRPEPAAPVSADGASAGPIFATLRNLLHERDRLDGAMRTGTGPGNAPVSASELQQVLDYLQRRPAGETAGHHDGEHLKNTLLVKLRRSSGGRGAPQLTGEDADTVDLVGMLFDHIAQNLSGGNQVRSLLSRLQVPVLRVALADKSFFSRRDHPARELLNAIAETSTRWLDDEGDPALLTKLQGVVDRVSSEFTGDVSVFADLLGDLNRHLHTLMHRAELAERRQVEAARGRDKLEVAFETARATIQRIIRETGPDRLARLLLEEAWTDALALSVLRHGASSDEFRRRVETARAIAADRAAGAVDPLFRQTLETGLREVGLHEEEVAGVFGELNVPAAESQQASERVDATLQSRQRLGGASAQEPPPEPLRLNEAEAEQLVRLQRVPFGTWFEFVTNQQGERVRRKLAWYSPVSGRCLFVNQRGGRSDERTLAQLARAMVRNQAFIVPPESGSIIDRTWNTIMHALRRNAPASSLAQGASA